MNKRFLLVAALCAAMNAASFAQTNLALNKTVVVSSQPNNGNIAEKLTDGNLGTRWEVNADDNEKEVSDEANDYTVTKGHWCYIDLGEETEFNTIRISWDAAYAKSFEVLTAPALKDDETEPTWNSTPILEKEETLTDFSKYYTYFLETPAKARYVKVQAKKLGFAGNWYSINELGIYNLTEDQKVPVITKMTASAEYVQPGATFKVSLLDQFDNDMKEGITYDLTNATQESDGSFKATESGEVIVKATDKQGNSKEVKLTAYVPTLTTVKVSPAIVVTGKETILTFIAKDQQGKDITDFTTSVEDNKITATEDGKQEITISYKGTEQKVAVYAVSKGQDAPTLGANDEKFFIDEAEGLNYYSKDWEGGYTSNDIIDLNGNKVMRATNVATFGFQKAAISETGYTTLNFDIYSSKDNENAYIAYERTGLNNLPFQLKAGEWKHVILDVSDATSYNSYIKFKVGTAGAIDNPDILVDNVYLTKPSATDIIVSPTADKNGFISIKGTINADNVAKLKELEGTAFDLSKVTRDGVTTVEFKNPNAIIQVAGTVDGQVAVPTADWGDTKNIVVQRNDGYYFPAKQLEITDKAPVFTTYFISGQVGFKYTRQLAANTSNTVYLPSGASASVPEGCKAYEMVQGDDANTIKLNEVNALAEKTPYIVYNGNTEEATLVAEQKAGDVIFQKTNESSKTIGNLTANGTYQYFNGDGTQYGLQASTGNTLKLKKIDGGTICPFRVYFTVAQGADAKAISFDFGNTTGINEVNATDAAKAANIYSIDGKLVKANATSTEGLAKGIYIINGKKYIVK